MRAMWELVKTYKGYKIRKQQKNGYIYVSSYNAGKYEYVLDYTYAKTFTERAALNRLKELEGEKQC